MATRAKKQVRFLLPGEEGAPPPLIIPARNSDVDVDKRTGLPRHTQTAFTEFKLKLRKCKSMEDFVELVGLDKRVVSFYQRQFSSMKWEEAISQDAENYFLILRRVKFSCNRKYLEILMFLQGAEEDIRLFAYSQLARIIAPHLVWHGTITDEYRRCLNSLAAFMPQ